MPCWDFVHIWEGRASAARYHWNSTCLESCYWTYALRALTHSKTSGWFVRTRLNCSPPACCDPYLRHGWHAACCKTCCFVNLELFAHRQHVRWAQLDWVFTWQSVKMLRSWFPPEKPFWKGIPVLIDCIFKGWQVILQVQHSFFPLMIVPAWKQSHFRFGLAVSMEKCNFSPNVEAEVTHWLLRLPFEKRSQCCRNNGFAQ